MYIYIYVCLGRIIWIRSFASPHARKSLVLSCSVQARLKIDLQFYFNGSFFCSRIYECAHSFCTLLVFVFVFWWWFCRKGRGGDCWVFSLGFFLSHTLSILSLPPSLSLSFGDEESNHAIDHGFNCVILVL